jgi:hypothetical protein
VSSALAVAAPKREGSAALAQRKAESNSCTDSEPQEVGVPRWLQHQMLGGDASAQAGTTGGDEPSPVQAKLEVNRPGDQFENQADRVAAEVMQRPDATRSDQAPTKEQPVSRGGGAVLQRKCTSCGGGHADDEELCPQCAQRRPARDAVPNVKRSVAGPLTTAALHPPLRGEPLAPSIRSHMERAFGTDLSGVRIHTDAQSSAAAQELNANAFTYGRDIFFGAGNYQPDTSKGGRLLAHEITHTLQQNAESSSLHASPQSDYAVGRHDDPEEREARAVADRIVQGKPISASLSAGQPFTHTSPRRIRCDDQQGVVVDAITPLTANDFSRTASFRNFSFQVVPAEPDLFAVPEDATREEIANRLFGDKTQTRAFRFVPIADIPVVDGLPGKAVRVTQPDLLVPEATTVLRTALDQALEQDANWTIDKLSERIIGGSEESELAERCLRWSQRSDMKNAAGRQYFDAYLERLDARILVSFWGTRKTGFGWLLVEVEEKREQLRKAIELRSSYTTQYKTTEQSSEFTKGEAIGRFYQSEGGSVRLEVSLKIANEDTLQAAEIKVRNYFFPGIRAIVPASNNRFYGYLLTARHRDNPRGKPPEQDPAGHFYWYYPGTIGVRPDEFQRAFDTGGEAERKQRSDILTTALAMPAQVAGLLQGLDYDVLALATPDQRVEIIRRTLNDPLGIWSRSKALIVRVLQSVPPTDSAVFEESLAEEGLLSRLIEIADPAITALLGPRLTAEDQALVAHLEESSEAYTKYAGWKLLLPSAKYTGKLIHEKGEALNVELKELGWAADRKGPAGTTPSLAAFGEAVKSFTRVFQRYALQSAFAILAENEKLIRGEYAHYGGAVSGGGIAQLRKALDPLKTKVQAWDAAKKVVEEKHKNAAAGASPAGGYHFAEEENKARAIADKAEEEARKQAFSMAPVFPVLADPRLDLSALVNADDAGMQRLLQSQATDRLSDIAKTRQRLAADPERVWQMEGAIARARIYLNVLEGSVLDQIIKAKLQEIKEDNLFKNLLLGALAIGLGVLSGGTGTLAVLAAVGSAGLTTYQLSEHIREFVFKQAAAGTAFDRARALTADDPSYFWLAVDIATAILDVGMAAKALTKLKPTVAAAIETKDAAKRAELLAKLKDDAKSLEGVEKSAEETAAGASVAAKETGAGASVAAKETSAAKNADELAEKIVADTERRIKGKEALEKLGPEAETLKALVKGDEAAAGGLARMEAGARGQVIDALKDSPDGLRRLGNMLQESDEVATAMERLSTAFVSQGKRADQFKAILEKYMLTSNRKAPNILRAIGKVGLDDADLAKIVDELKTLKSPDYIGVQFGKKALEAIGQKLPSGKQGINDLLDLTHGMEQSQAGSIFEHWARKNIYKQGMDRYAENTSDLVANFGGKYHRTRVTTDSVLDNGPGNTIVDFKNYLSPRGFTKGTEQGRQLIDYGTMLQNGVKGPGGKPFTQVEYLFSTKEAAERAANDIKNVLGNRGKIRYVDRTTGDLITL